MGTEYHWSTSDSFLFFLIIKFEILNNHPLKCKILSTTKNYQPVLWMLGASALGRPRGMVWGGRREEGSGWGTHAYPWQIHFDIWQN